MTEERIELDIRKIITTFTDVKENEPQLTPGTKIVDIIFPLAEYTFNEEDFDEMTKTLVKYIKFRKITPPSDDSDYYPM